MAESEDIDNVDSGDETAEETLIPYAKWPKKQQLFADLFLDGLNATKAYIGAGYSETGANGNASALISNHSISYHIEEQLAERRQSNTVIIEKVRRYWDHVMEAVDVTDGTSVAEGNKASELLMKHVGGFEKDNTQKTPVNVNVHWTPA